MRENLIALMMFLLVCVFLCFIVFTLDKAKCTAKAESFDAVKHSFIGGCMVKHKGRWLPLENIRGFE